MNETVDDVIDRVGQHIVNRIIFDALAERNSEEVDGKVGEHLGRQSSPRSESPGGCACATDAGLAARRDGK